MIAPWFWRWAQWRRGRGPFVGHACDPAFRPAAPRRIPGWAWRRLARMVGVPVPPVAEEEKRALAVAYEWWAINHEAAIGYEEVRPMSAKVLTHPWRLPYRADCSMEFTLAYKAAGARDPNGSDYDGWGNTTTLTAHGRRVLAHSLRKADAVLFLGEDYTKHHVAFVLEPGSDPLLCSHGMERGPIAIRLSEEAAYHRRQPIVFCTYDL